MEACLYCEKRLLQARGVLSNASSRTAGYTPDLPMGRYVDELNERILSALEQHKPRRPGSEAVVRPVARPEEDHEQASTGQ